VKLQLQNRLHCSGGCRLFFFINQLRLGLLETDPLGLHQGSTNLIALLTDTDREWPTKSQCVNRRGVGPALRQ
jgi:hypothetical protein